MMWGNNPGTGGTATLIPQNSVGAELGVWPNNASYPLVKTYDGFVRKTLEPFDF